VAETAAPFAEAASFQPAGALTPGFNIGLVVPQPASASTVAAQIALQVFEFI
jgi:hypothetical protein